MSATNKFAIRFGLAAIKAVGTNITQNIVNERKGRGQFKDIYDFAKRIDNKFINKKSIEALAKSGSFDCIANNRKQLAESFDILSAYGSTSKEQENSNQMTFFASSQQQPALKKTADWQSNQRLQAEFEAFGFFLNKHPIDDYVVKLKKRGVVFSSKLEEDSLLDGSLIKMAGIVISSKHRSSGKGRFAYVYVSDQLGIYEVMFYDENLITNNRDLLNDGSQVVIDCLIKKDDGGSRIMAKAVSSWQDFLNKVPESQQEFEDIKIIKKSNNFNKNESTTKTINSANKTSNQHSYKTTETAESTSKDQPIKSLEITIKSQKAILPLKTILAQKISDSGIAIFLFADDQKIALANRYNINKSDVFRLQNINTDIAVKVIY